MIENNFYLRIFQNERIFSLCQKNRNFIDGAKQDGKLTSNIFSLSTEREW